MNSLALAQVRRRLARTPFTKVIWCGELYLAASPTCPRVFMGYDVGFYDPETDSLESPREYLLGSPTRRMMDEIVEILRSNDAPEGFEVFL